MMALFDEEVILANYEREIRSEGRAEGRVAILWEDGRTVEEIAARLSMSEEEVERIIMSLDE